MKNFRIIALTCGLVWGLAGPILAQSPSSNASGDAGDKPFKPYYENELQAGSTNQQGGQSSGFLTYTGTFHLDEGGDSLGFGAEETHQKVEGVGSNVGSLLLNGGLGMGFFSPSLAVNLGGGEKGWHQATGELTLDFQLWDPFSVNLVFGGSAEYHQGDASEVVKSLPGIILIDVAGANSSLGFTFTPWDWWSISTTLEYQNDSTNITYRGVKYDLNKSDQVATLSLGLDFTLAKDFTLDLSPQVGKIYYPVGLSYSIESGGLVFNSVANSQNFTGGTVSLSLSFE